MFCYAAFATTSTTENKTNQELIARIVLDPPTRRKDGAEEMAGVEVDDVDGPADADEKDDTIFS
jgi:hypothetical protein